MKIRLGFLLTTDEHRYLHLSSSLLDHVTASGNLVNWSPAEFGVPPSH